VIKGDITAYISSKDRYFTTLPLAIQSILNQSLLPKRFILFIDGQHMDLRTNSIYSYIFSLLNDKGIEWEVVYTPHHGQIKNHQLAVDMSRTEFLWRVDDDEVAEYNVLEELYKVANNDKKIGAVAGLVIDPTSIKIINDLNLDNKIKDIYSAPNCQWFKHIRTDVFSVEHLYSSFLYRREAAKNMYCLELSIVGHREETIASHQIFRNGWKLLVNPNVITWHFRNPEGGIRGYTDKALWDHDEAIFSKKMEEWAMNVQDDFNVVLDCGRGDTWAFKHILTELKEKHGERLVLYVCYPEIFEGDNVKLLSIADAKNKFGGDIEKFNLYRWADNNGHKGNLVEAYRAMYL
jgi:hypothetical protein